MIKERNYALDMMKVLAAIMITNSHFIPLYKDVNIGLATFGVHGNALFFFVSGYLLTMGLSKKEERFDHWYKRRINRLLPAMLLWYIFVMDYTGGGFFLSFGQITGLSIVSSSITLCSILLLILLRNISTV
ncbi:MAG: acyltransferase [Prevotella ruminicola]|jgi:peptidoglycan/LPS O-acetylase OafA/YrhL|uniref:Acyltransferase n=1 Tax=Xylanibacter ruminicola TaxID=839 RepID=A0A9D5P3K1_XYLRU|nr:acyltransferase [Xylanibacter ruminicola]